jgi:hypothetical protein
MCTEGLVTQTRTLMCHQMVIYHKRWKWLAWKAGSLYPGKWFEVGDFNLITDAENKIKQLKSASANAG